MNKIISAVIVSFHITSQATINKLATGKNPDE